MGAETDVVTPSQVTSSELAADGGTVRPDVVGAAADQGVDGWLTGGAVIGADVGTEPGAFVASLAASGVAFPPALQPAAAMRTAPPIDTARQHRCILEPYRLGRGQGLAPINHPGSHTPIDRIPGVTTHPEMLVAPKPSRSDRTEAEMERSPEIEQLIHDWFDSASRGDPALIDKHVSPEEDVRLVGSDPGEWLRGGDSIAEFLRGEVTGAAGNVTFTPSDTEAFQQGPVGWAATRLTIALPDGRRVTPRWTAVFVRSDGAWQFVQTHASIGVGNDDIGWTFG